LPWSWYLSRACTYWAVFYARAGNESRANYDIDPAKVPGRLIPRQVHDTGASRHRPIKIHMNFVSIDTDDTLNFI